VTALIAVIGFVVFASRRLLTYLHLFKQEEYDNPRFLAWLWRERAFDRRLSLVLLAVLVAQFLLQGWAVPPGVFAAVAGVACAALAIFERDPRKTAKKALAMTTRAKRIYGIALAL